ncbi:MAG: UPF0158 family protein [Ignavibacteriaceae bacterium]|jgi:hypothetical protein
MELTQEQIKSIAEEIEIGMKVFVNFQTKEIKSLPDFDNNIYAGEEEWEDDIKEIDEKYDNYLQFDPMSSQESFNMMEEFAEGIKDEALRIKLFRSLNHPKPFKHFKIIIDNSGKTREKWFEFRNSKFIELVKEQLDRYNNKLQE